MSRFFAFNEVMNTIEEQRNKYRQSLNGESVSIPTIKEKKTYIKSGKKKSNRGKFITNAKRLYG